MEQLSAIKYGDMIIMIFLNVAVKIKTIRNLSKRQRSRVKEAIQQSSPNAKYLYKFWGNLNTRFLIQEQFQSHEMTLSLMLILWENIYISRLHFTIFK